MIRIVGCAVVLLLVAVRGVGQSPGAARIPDPLAKERVASTLQELASDAMAGRDTPSPELDRAAELLVARLKAAGVQPGGKGGSYFHTYRKAAARLAQAGIAVRVTGPDGKELVLRPDQDVRVFRVGRAYEVRDTEVERAGPAQLARRGAQQGAAQRRPLFLEVPEDGAVWQAHAKAVTRLARGGRGGAPWLLVRKGVLPEGALRATIAIPEPESVEVELRNVVAVLPGTQRAEEHVLLSAHYDHVGIGTPNGDDAIYNGADDNATGTTAVLLLAEKLAGTPQPRSVTFAFFSGEEKGLIGSRAFADDPPFPLERIVANLNLEMLGRPKPNERFQAWLTGRGLSDLESIVAPALRAEGVEVVAFPMEAMLFQASDNFSLAAKGVVAHSLSAGHLHADYHKPDDEVDRIDTEHMARVLRGLHAATKVLASGGTVPRWNEEERKRLRLPQGESAASQPSIR
ncbi:MAG: M28 family peptidase [Planctomycetes bacterium]|nr:M28 family peptidase [Planctomycetota bacterium]